MVIRVVIILKNFVVARLLLLLSCILILLSIHRLVARHVRVLRLLARARPTWLFYGADASIGTDGRCLIHLLD